MSEDNTQENTPLQIQERNNVLNADDGIEWRYGRRPDYSKTDKTLRAQSQLNHPPGSLEAIVQNLVRTFEMEATYKLNPAQWSSIDPETFRMRTNNGPEYTAAEIAERGTYNLFLGESEHYSSSAEDFESSVSAFKTAFKTGFVWEVLEVYVGPPKVVFKWRHWGTHQGEFKGHEATDQLIEVFGITVADVNDKLQLTRVEHTFDNSQFFQKLTSGGKMGDVSKCPMHSLFGLDQNPEANARGPMTVTQAAGELVRALFR